MIYSKTLQAKAYDDIKEVQDVLLTNSRLKGVRCRFDHPHRAWEYGLVLSALVANGAKTVLEIGGGASLFAPTVALRGIEIMQVDRKNCSAWTTAQEERLGISLPYVQQNFPDEYIAEEQFDAVVSISVIEHTSTDASVHIDTRTQDVDKRAVFFERMLDLVTPGGLVAITTDFHPNKASNVKFSEDEIMALYEIGRRRGFDWFGGEHDYTYAGNLVNYYTFASMVLRRENGD